MQAIWPEDGPCGQGRAPAEDRAHIYRERKQALAALAFSLWRVRERRFTQMSRVGVASRRPPFYKPPSLGAAAFQRRSEASKGP